MRCNCENEKCTVGHEMGDCQNEATVPTTFGSICSECKEDMPAEYLRDGEENDGYYNRYHRRSGIR